MKKALLTIAKKKQTPILFGLEVLIVVVMVVVVVMACLNALKHICVH